MVESTIIQGMDILLGIALGFVLHDYLKEKIAQLWDRFDGEQKHQKV